MSASRAAVLRDFLTRYAGFYSLVAPEVPTLVKNADYINPAGNLPGSGSNSASTVCPSSGANFRPPSRRLTILSTEEAGRVAFLVGGPSVGPRAPSYFTSSPSQA